MKQLVLVFLVFVIKTYAQPNNQPHALGATPTDVATLKPLTLAVPPSGAAVPLPRSFRMDNECPEPNDQGGIGSCVSQATAYGLCSILAKRSNQPYPLSPEYMHYFIKQSSPQCNTCDCMGSNLGLAAKFLTTTGVPKFSDFNPDPYNNNECQIKPGNLQIVYKLSSFQPLFISGVSFVSGYKKNAIRSFLASGNPVPVSMDIDNGFWRGDALKNEDHVWRTFMGNPVGGHAMLIVGYDDDKNAFLVMNSWGKDWNIVQGDPTYTLKGGYCWIDYDIVEQHAYEAFVANVDNNAFAITIGQLIQTSASVTKSQESIDLTANKNNYFEENRFQQFDNIRFIPTSVDKNTQSSTIAIYTVENGNPQFISAFDIKVGESKKLTIEQKVYTFVAKKIKPWRKKFGIFNSKPALYFKLEKNN